MEDRGNGGRGRRRSPRKNRPSLEAMERRDLLSVIPIIEQAQKPTLTASDVIQAAAISGASTTSQGLNPTGSQSPLIGTDPTPRELAREKFTAVFSGPVYVGPGRFANQSKTLYFRGLGTSNAFLHGDFQMAIVFPTDPTAPLTGEAIMQDKNTNSQGILALPMTGLTPQTYDKQGRPTDFTFSTDPNIYSGIFFVNTSAGTVHITYSKGSAKVTFKGLVYTTGLTNPLTNSDLYSRGGRITPISGRAN
jgi:hypothetical protein